MPILMLGAWWLYTVQRDDPKFPRPTTIIVEVRKLFFFSQFDTHVLPSLERIGLGFAIAVILGVALGIPLGLSRIGRSAAMPHIEYWRAIPPPALLPISIILLHSIGNLQKISFIAFFCIFPVLLNTIDGVRGIEPTLIDTARSYRIPTHERIRRIVFPAALPQIFAGMRTSLALAVIVMVLSEYFSTHQRGRLRPADLEEHVPVPADVGGDRADRRARLPAQRPLPPRRALRARLASRLARGDATVIAMLEIRGLAKTYGTGATATHAVGNVSFSIDEGEFVCVVGPSGCGKTTLLKCIAGLLRPSPGQVLLRGAAVTGPPEQMALVFQEYSRSLMPWMSVRNNVLLPLRHKKLSKQERRSLSRTRSARSGSSSSWTATRGSSQAGCSSASRSPAPSPTSRRSS